jgi:hypothetical protein
MALAGIGFDHIVLRSRSQQWRAKSLMPPRIRKLVGAVALFALVIVWALVAMAIAQFPPIFNNPWIAGIYYVIAGIGWVLPAMPLIRWMSKSPVS